MDVAETFAESDVSVSHDLTEVNAESLEIGTDPTKTENIDAAGDFHEISVDSVGTDSHTHTHDVDGWNILYIKVDPRWFDIDGTISVDVNGNEVISETRNGTPDSTIDPTFSVEVDVSDVDSAEVVYTVEVTNSNDGALNLDHEGGDESAVERRDGPALDGSAIVSWPAPADLVGWDIVPFQATPDGETLEVYIEDQNGNELAGPLDDPGDISDISRSTNVRVRVELSRASTSNNPRLEAVYRRYKV